MMLIVSADMEKDLSYLHRFPDDDSIVYIEYSQNNETLPNFNIDLIQEYIKRINETFPNREMKYKVNYQMSEKFILEYDNCKNLEKIDNYLRENYDTELLVSGKGESFGYGFRKTLSANRKLDSVAEKIKNATHNGEPLSNFEKYMVAYEYVTQYLYNEGGDVYHNETSHWVPVIEGDKIVCAGYASLLEALCARIFNPEEVQVMYQGLDVFNKNTNEYIAGHANNLVYLKDDKYGIDGLFYTDACWDAIKDTRKDKQQAFCCIPINDILQYKHLNLIFRSGITSLLLKQNKDYQANFLKTKKDSFYEIYQDPEEEMENFLFGYRKDAGAQFCKEKFKDINIYDTDGFKNTFLKDYPKIEKEINERIDKKFKKTFDKYSKLEIPTMLSKEFIKYYNLQEHLDNICNELLSTKEIQDSLKIIEKALKDNMAQNYIAKVKKVGLAVTTLNKFAKTNMQRQSIYAVRKTIEEEFEKKQQKLKKENLKIVMNRINKITDSQIPIEAFIKSYKIIGSMKGLKDEELKDYVENRIKKGIERTAENFEIENCKSCFAVAKLEQLEKKIKQM